MGLVLMALLVLVLPIALICGGVAFWSLRGPGHNDEDVKAATRRGWARSSWMN